MTLFALVQSLTIYSLDRAVMNSRDWRDYGVGVLNGLVFAKVNFRDSYRYIWRAQKYVQSV